MNKFKKMCLRFKMSGINNNKKGVGSMEELLKRVEKLEREKKILEQNLNVVMLNCMQLTNALNNLAGMIVGGNQANHVKAKDKKSRKIGFDLSLKEGDE